MNVFVQMVRFSEALDAVSAYSEIISLCHLKQPFIYFSLIIHIIIQNLDKQCLFRSLQIN